MLKKGLRVEVPPHSDILRITFEHSNREIVQDVLKNLIDAYLRKHAEIHRSAGAFDDVLSQQTDTLRLELEKTEAALRKAQTNTGVLSIEESKKTYTEELSKVRQEIFDTQAELARLQAVAAEHQKLMPSKAETPSEKPDANVPADRMEEYKSICGRLDAFRKKEQDLLAQYTEENSLVRGIRERIASAEKTQRKLEADYPILAMIRLSSSKPDSHGVEVSDDPAQIIALQAKLNILTSQLTNLTAEAKVVNEAVPVITELQRKRDMEETKYRHFSTSLDQANFDKMLGSEKMSNISVAQAPSPAVRQIRELAKILSVIAISGVVAGLVLAFLIEHFLDPTVRRPVEVESRLNLPLFLTIPWTNRNGRPPLPPPTESGPAKPEPGEAAPEPGTEKKSEVARWDASGLASYYEALRDRLVGYFDDHNVVHKPKLIAVTGCAKGAGVTTIATGLAASLSETGDGNVLLVDMTTKQGAAHPFFKGKPGLALTDALATDKRENALVQDRLYMVSEAGRDGALPRVLPRRFGSLVPKLKASDYDYIIFDMPPVSQISITPRLAGYMDKVVLVLESERTDRDAAKRATAMLREVRANVSAVLNKNVRYVPERLQQEI